MYCLTWNIHINKDKERVQRPMRIIPRIWKMLFWRGWCYLVYTKHFKLRKTLGAFLSWLGEVMKEVLGKPCKQTAEYSS